MKSLFHLVSGQNLPNYIAADYIKPDEHVYFYTKGSKPSLQHLKQVLGGAGSEIEIDAYDYASVQQAIEREIQKRVGDTVTLNFTGGTKIMSLAAFESFRKNGQSSVYVNTDNSTILVFHGAAVGVTPITGIITPQVYLNLQGQNVRPPAVAALPEYEALQEQTANFLIRHYGPVYPFVMRFANKFREIGKTVNFEAGPRSMLKGSYIRFANNTASFCVVLNGKLLFERQTTGKQYLEFLRGKWFETAVYLKLKKSGLFDSIAQSIEIDWKRSYGYLKYGKNELDVFCMKGVMPHVFECKAGNIETEAVNKLKALKETFLGRFSNIYFVSLKQPRPDIQERLEEQGITVVNYWELQGLGRMLQKQESAHLK